MTTAEHTIAAYIEEAHGALVCAAKEAHLVNHPQAENISKLIDALEDFDLKNSAYQTKPVDIEYGIFGSFKPEKGSKINCPSKPIIIKTNKP